MSLPLDLEGVGEVEELCFESLVSCCLSGFAFGLSFEARCDVGQGIMYFSRSSSLSWPSAE